MFIASYQAFRNRAQSCDLAVVGASALQHVSVGRLLEELVLIHTQWLRQVVWLHGMNTVQTMRNGRIRSRSALVVVGTRCLRARPDEVFERSPVARSLSGM